MWSAIVLRRAIVPVCAVAIAAVFGLLQLARADEEDKTVAVGDWPLRIILSTDVSIGLIDTHGGSSLAPAPFDATHAYTTDANVRPQDVDDGLTLAAALNMDAAGLLELLAIVPTYGNASLPPEMVVARHITQNLKGRNDILIAPGARLPAGQILNPTATWYDGRTVKVEGEDGSFAAACGNAGVGLMLDKLLDDAGPVTILAIGPLTDTACLLQTAPNKALQNIREIIFLASQMEGEPILVNGKPINDFNVRIDPLGAALVLAADRVSVPLRFIPFRLSGKTSQSGDVFTFDRATYPGPMSGSEAGRASYEWLLAASKPARQSFINAFGSAEGPFDQYTLVAAVQPDLFDCRAGYAYVQMCPYPAWSRKYPTDSERNPTQLPYNAPNNPCVDHGGSHSAFYNSDAARLVITTSQSQGLVLVRGQTGIDGNIPQFDGVPARNVTVCTNFASENARTTFEELLKKWTW